MVRKSFWSKAKSFQAKAKALEEELLKSEERARKTLAEEQAAIRAKEAAMRAQVEAADKRRGEAQRELNDQLQKAGKPSLSAALSVLASATAVCVLLGCAPAIHALIQKGADKKAAEDLAYTLGMAVGLLYLVKKVN